MSNYGAYDSMQTAHDSRRRYGTFMFVVFLHIAAFYALGHFIIFSAPPPPDAEQVFQPVKIWVPPSVVPPPPPSAMPTLPAMAGGSSSTSSPMPIEVNTTIPKFNVPMPSVNDSALSQHIEDSLLARGLAGHGSGTGTGSGNGTSTGTGDGTGDGGIADICGLKIPTQENVVIIEDIWEAQHSTGSARIKVQRYAEECIEKFFFGVTPIQVDGGLTDYNPKNKHVHSR